MLMQKLSHHRARCLVCQHRCLLQPGQIGICQARRNENGIIKSLTYGIISTPIQVDPIEKKPLYNFYPGLLVPSIGSFGWNFRCRQCLNYQIAWGPESQQALQQLRQGKHFTQISPQKLVATIKQQGYQAIAFTYNEPVINAEFVYDTARLAKKAGLKTILVSNGSWTREWIDTIGPYIDAANIDFKAYRDDTYRRMGAFKKQVFTNTAYAQKKGIFIEITTLIIPTINDSFSREIKPLAHWMVKNLGPDTPWHLSRFEPQLAPDPEFQKLPPTPVATLKKAAQIGRQAGLHYVYVWAPPDYSEGNTYCPHCGHLVVKRQGWQPEFVGLDEKGRCRYCGHQILIR